MKKVFAIVFFVFLSANLFAQTPKDYTRYVNPLVGTGGHGHTFPGATVPFGFVQLSPDTRMDDWDGSSGYHYSDNQIYGFSHTHLSGTGIPDYCDVLLMPTVGEPEFFAKKGDVSENGYASIFSHQNEKAEAGYYSVKLDEGNILAEMTATARVGFHRYTFPAKAEANLILDLKHRDKVLDSELRITGANRIEGFRRSSSWAKDQIVYFAAEFSEPFADYGVSMDDGAPEKQEKSKGKNIKAFFRFASKRPLLVKVAISPVGVSGVRRNLTTEIPHWDFEKTRREAKDTWNKQLSKIEVSGGSDEQFINFYTALYHTMIHPNVFQDTDKSYLGLDRQIHSAQDFTNYTVFSLWDTFRAAHPLYTIIERKRTADFINTFLRQYEQGGRLPVWELAANETDTMIGYHAVSVIADAMAKGIEGVDYEKAFEAAKHSAELNHFGLEAYKKRGYISMEDEQESVSKTLEYAYDDWCIAQMAILLTMRNGKDRTIKTADERKQYEEKHKRLNEDFWKYSQRSKYFENLFDPETGFMRPKQNGGFVKPFAPNEVTFHFTEGNSWQYTFFVQHDINRLIALYRYNLSKKLDEFFTTEAKLTGREQPDITGLIGQYAHGNEPSHHIAYLYNYANQPWKTQMYVRKILDEFYKPTPDGLIGNEDCGQMSAWYVLSASGFYPVTPGEAFYDLGTPLFKEVKYNLENGKTFTIKAPNVSDKNIYVKSVRINGEPQSSPRLWHGYIMNGSVLEFEMSSNPLERFFNGFSKSGIDTRVPAVPLIEGAEKVFRNQNTITLKTTAPKTKIFYTLDGSEPNEQSSLYEKPLTIDKTTVVKAVSVFLKGGKSPASEARFYKKPNDWTVRLFSKYNRQYTGGGDEGLIDGIRGTTNFASGEWQGYQSQDFVAVVDLQKETEIRKLGGGFLQIARSWIWMPTRVEFEVSNDNVNFTKVADIKTDVAPEDMEQRIRDYKTDIKPTKARYVRVKASNLGKIPAWHPGAGFDAFIFVDEIFIE